MITLHWFVLVFIMLTCIEFGFCLGGHLVKRQQQRDQAATAPDTLT